MAVRRRRRRAHPVASNRRRRANPTVRRRRRGVHAASRTNRRVTVVNRRRRRRANPVVRHRRRRNPAFNTGLITDIMAAGAGVIITDMLQGIIPIQFGGAWGRIGARLGIAWLAGYAAEKAGFAKYSKLITIGGGIGAIQDAFRLVMGGGGVLSPSQPVVIGPPGQLAMPDSEGVGDLIYSPGGGMGEIIYAPSAQGLYQ
jgi:hypothetical protein